MVWRQTKPIDKKDKERETKEKKTLSLTRINNISKGRIKRENEKDFERPITENPSIQRRIKSWVGGGIKLVTVDKDILPFPSALEGSGIYERVGQVYVGVWEIERCVVSLCKHEERTWMHGVC